MKLENNPLNTILGFYSPSFLRMHVATNKSLQQLSTLNAPKVESTYLHEYIHFIQALSTFFGLYKIFTTVDYMKFANNNLINSPKGPFQIPICPEKIDNSISINKFFVKAYTGEYFFEDDDGYVVFKAHRKYSKTFSCGSKELPISFIFITYTDYKNKKKIFKFGAYCIMESMAYIIEKLCYPNASGAPDLPYSSAEKLVALILPELELAKDPLNVLALCDASLMSLDPGEVFYETLIKIKNEGIKIEKPEDIYQICKEFTEDNNSEFSSQDTPQNGDTISFQDMSKKTKDQFLDLFPHNSFKQQKDWLGYMFQMATDYRLEHEYFPLDIARRGEMKNNKSFIEYFNKVGIPFVTNGSYEMTYRDPRENPTPVYPEFLWAINEIHSVFTGRSISSGTTECEMIDWCSANQYSTDDKCHNAPWKRANDNYDKLCPFAQIWKSWGLQNYFPKV